MNRKCILFKGCYVSPGTNLHVALETKPRDDKLIEKMYKDLSTQFKRDYGDFTNDPSNVRRMEEGGVSSKEGSEISTEK